MPHLTHPNSRQRIEVTDQQVPLYVSQGWRAAADTKPRRKRATKSTAPTKGAAK